MFERFTHDARDVVVTAQEHAISSLAREIEVRHLLSALTTEPLGRLLAEHGLTRAAIEACPRTLTSDDEAALRSLGIDLDWIREAVEAEFGEGALDRPLPAKRSRMPWRRTVRHLPFSKRAKKALELSLREAVRLESGHIGAEHVALGALRSEDPVVAALGTDVPALRTALEHRLRDVA